MVLSDERPRSSVHTFSRRTLLAAVPGLALIVAGVACGDDDDDTSAAPTATTAPTSSADTSPTAADEASPTAAEEGTTEESGGSGWTFIDDRGETISRDIQPTRVVAYLPIAASLWDFGLEVVGVFGTTLRPDGTPEIYAGNVDLDKVVSLGETYGEIDLEKLVDLKPELVVFDIYDAAEFDLWGLPGDAVDQVASIADLVGISFVGAPVTSTIERIGELAEAVGADLSAAAVVGDRDAFETASQSVRDALPDKAELTSLFVAAWPENLYVANPQILGRPALLQGAWPGHRRPGRPRKGALGDAQLGAGEQVPVRHHPQRCPRHCAHRGRPGRLSDMAGAPRRQGGAGRPVVHRVRPQLSRLHDRAGQPR